jgi:hypothetical protein
MGPLFSKLSMDKNKNNNDVDTVPDNTHSENNLTPEQQQNEALLDTQNENNSEMKHEIVAVVTNLLDDIQERNMIVEPETLETTEEVLDNVADIIVAALASPAVEAPVAQEGAAADGEAPAAVEEAPVMINEAPAAVEETHVLINEASVTAERPETIEHQETVEHQETIERPETVETNNTIVEERTIIEEDIEVERSVSHDSDKASKKKKRKGKK